MASLASPKSQKISTLMCYKNKVLVSYKFDPSIHLYSLSAIPYSYLSHLPTSSPILHLDWGYKQDIILACAVTATYVLKINESKIALLNNYQIPSSIGVFSYLNDFILLGSDSGEVIFFSLLSGCKVLSYSHKSIVTGIDINYEDNLIVSCSLDATCVLYNTSDKKKLKTLEFSERDHTSPLPFAGCSFSKNGDVLFTIAHYENAYLTQWETKEMLPICSYPLHAGRISKFCMSVDGFFIGIGTHDGWIKILNTRTMDFEKRSEEFSNPVSAISFTYDSRHIVTGSESEFKNIFNTRGEGFFSKASKIWVISIFLLWFYLYFR